MRLLRVYGRCWGHTLAWHCDAAAVAMTSGPLHLDFCKPEQEDGRRGQRIAGHVRPLAAAPIEWRGEGLGIGAEAVDEGDFGTCVHYADGMLVFGDSLPPEAFLAGSCPSLTAHGAFGALMHRCLLAAGCLSLHAAVLSVSDRALVVLGDSRSGKSTLAAAWMHARRRIVTDDAAVILPPAQDGASWWAEAWRMDVGLRADVAARLARSSTMFSQAADLTPHEKRWVRRDEHPQCFRSCAPIAALVFLESETGHRPRRSGASKLSKAEALARLLSLYPILSRTDAVSQCARASAARLVAQLPTAALQIGHELLASPLAEISRIDDLLASVLPGIETRNQRSVS